MGIEAIWEAVARHGEVVVLASIFAAELGIPMPVPNELLLAWAGHRAATGAMPFSGLWAGAVAADQAGSLLFYAICRFGGRPLFHRYGRWVLLPPARWSAAEARLARAGPLAFFVGRVVPFLRIYSSGAAGLLGLSWRVVLPVGLAASIVWVTSFVAVGMVIRQGIDLTMRGQNLSPALQALAILVIVGVGVLGVYHFRKGGVRRADPPRE